MSLFIDDWITHSQQERYMQKQPKEIKKNRINKNIFHMSKDIIRQYKPFKQTVNKVSLNYKNLHSKFTYNNGTNIEDTKTIGLLHHIVQQI